MSADKHRSRDRRRRWLRELLFIPHWWPDWAKNEAVEKGKKFQSLPKDRDLKRLIADGDVVADRVSVGSAFGRHIRRHRLRVKFK